MAESVRAEEENIRLANHMRLLLESTGEGIYGIDLNGHCTFINRSAASMLGYEVHEAYGRNMHELIHHSHPDGSPYLVEECPVLGAFRLGRGCRLTTEVLWRKDGSCFAAEISSHPIFEAGSITGAVVTFNDITERKRSQEALDRQNRELLTLHRISEMTLNAHSIESAFQEIVNEIRSVTGFPVVSIELYDPERQVMVFKGTAGIPLPSAGAPLEVPVTESLSGLVVTTGKLMIERSAWERPEYTNKTLRQLRVRTFVCAPLAVNEKVIGTLSLGTPEVRDLGDSFAPWITGLANSVALLIDRKGAEQQLREQAALLDHDQDAIFVRDLDERVIYWNKSAERIYGWSAEEVLGKDIRQILYQETPEIFGEAREATFQRGEWTGELLHLRRDGSTILVESRWALIRDEFGKAKSILVINTDITEKKGLEAELFRAEQLSLIGELAASLAHEIKNPLAGIQGAVDILIRRRDAGDPEREVLESVRNEVRRVDETMRALLDLSRPRALSVASRSLTAVVEKAVSLARDHVVRSNVARGRRLRLIFQTCDEPLVIPLDADQMEDAVLNLLLNAIDAIGDEGAVTVSVIRKEDPAVGRSEGVIKVEDSGRGIAREDLDKIFSPFFSTTPGGTGLGLPAVRRIMRAHGGRVGVQSTLGKGSIFTLHLPVPKSEKV